jgi:hypothetical protein
MKKNLSIIIAVTIFIVLLKESSSNDKLIEENESIKLSQTQPIEEIELDLDHLEKNDIIIRNDIESITSRFPSIQNIKEVFWEGGTIGKHGIGPTSYYIKGCIILESYEADNLKNKYTFEIIDNPKFKFDPEITGFSEFDWRESYSFANDILRNKFVGNVYFDFINGIIYFNAENT